jgi:hypothetical protein
VTDARARLQLAPALTPSHARTLTDSKLPCFTAFGNETAQHLRERFQLGLTQKAVDDHLERLIVSSIGSHWTRLYDSVRVACCALSAVAEHADESARQSSDTVPILLRGRSVLMKWHDLQRDLMRQLNLRHQKIKGSRCTEVAAAASSVKARHRRQGCEGQASERTGQRSGPA